MSPIPPPPREGEPAASARASAETLALLAARRSTPIAQLGEPGPDQAQLGALIRLAARAPDHGKLGPWRFVAMLGEARARAGAALAAVIAEDPGVDESRLAAERGRFARAPACVMVVSTAAPHPKIPEWEQQLSVGAVCFQLLLAAHAMGFGGTWLTEWPTYDARARAALGLAGHERIAGFVYLGTAQGPVVERVRPPLEDRIAWF